MPVCDKCQYLHATSYEYGEYECAAGVPEEKLVEWKSGCGCKYSQKQLKAKYDKIAQAEAEMYDGCVE